MLNKLLIIFIIILNNFFFNYTYSDDQITGIDLSTVKVLYIAVGTLFLVAAGLFIFSKNLPEAKGDTSFVQAPKAVKTLGLITLSLLLIFYFVFVIIEFTCFNQSDHRRIRGRFGQTCGKRSIITSHPTGSRVSSC